MSPCICDNLQKCEGFSLKNYCVFLYAVHVHVFCRLAVYGQCDIFYEYISSCYRIYMCIFTYIRSNYRTAWPLQTNVKYNSELTY